MKLYQEIENRTGRNFIKLGAEKNTLRIFTLALQIRKDRIKKGSMINMFTAN